MSEPANEPPSSAQVVVIGGGIIGLSIAWSCRQRGLTVAVIDRNPPQHVGCSHGNAGMIVPSHVIPLAAPGMLSLGLKWMFHPESPFAIRPRLSWDLFRWGYLFARSCNAQHVQRSAPVLFELLSKSRELYRDWSTQWNDDFGLTTRGLVMLCRTTRTLDGEGHAVEIARSLGMTAEVLDREGIANLDPGVQMDVAGGVLFPADCHLSPQSLMASLERRLAAAGCQFHWNCDVQGWLSEGRRITGVETTAGRITGEHFVLASGTWAPELAQKVGLSLPLEAGKGYSLTLANPKVLPTICSIGVEGRIAITPMGSQLRVGGTMELGNRTPAVSPGRLRGIVRSFCELFPDFRPEDFAGIDPWSGLRPCAPDGLPYIGHTRHCENLIIATGHAMMGLSLGPITGELVTKLVQGETPEIELTLLSPDRFDRV